MSTEQEIALSPEEIGVINEYQQAIRDVQQQIQGAIRLMFKTRKLEGNWNFQGDKFVRQSNVVEQ
jgi:hypothetical protein